MISFFFLPFFLLLLIVLQNKVSDILFLGNMGLEVSLILVIYAGFRLDVIRGGMISFLLGFFLDCVTGSLSGFHTFLYVFIYMISTIASLRMSLDKASFIMTFTFLCAVLKSVLMTILYPLIFRMDMSSQVLKTYLPQTLLIVLISPIVFHGFNRIETLLNGGYAKHSERT
jgi:rod shape-determining protein MreD